MTFQPGDRVVYRHVNGAGSSRYDGWIGTIDRDEGEYVVLRWESTGIIYCPDKVNVSALPTGPTMHDDWTPA